MSTRTIQLLHVEDERSQRLLVARHLKSLAEFQFHVACAASEDEAIEKFGQGGVEFVILDYHLSQGNGLDCLRRIRELDPIVPIVAISGGASAEDAADLLRNGADDFISKQDLTGVLLAQSVRAAVTRADACAAQTRGRVILHQAGRSTLSQREVDSSPLSRRERAQRHHPG